jgi:hypothetical protein
MNYALLLDRQMTDPTAKADLAEISAAAERAVVLSRDLAVAAARAAGEDV